VRPWDKFPTLTACCLFAMVRERGVIGRVRRPSLYLGLRSLSGE
jgi:hypothetical protein